MDTLYVVVGYSTRKEKKRASMSTASFPQNMRAMPASGYNHRSTVNGSNQTYRTWKPHDMPTEFRPGMVRPLTNRDPGNNYPSKFGLPRPLKHYRRGNLPLPPPDAATMTMDEFRNTYRAVLSSDGTSLEGIKALPDAPSANQVHACTNASNPAECGGPVTWMGGNGVPMVSSYMPNLTFRTDNPSPETCSAAFCCNPERKARRRAMYASTNVSQRYATTHFQYLQKRCRTFEQQSFHYRLGDPALAAALPPNTFLANCQPDALIARAEISELRAVLLNTLQAQGWLTATEAAAVQEATGTMTGWTGFLAALHTAVASSTSPGADAAAAETWINAYLSSPLLVDQEVFTSRAGCALTTYKPNNPQFAQQGAVDSSTALLQRKVQTITTSAAHAEKGDAKLLSDAPMDRMVAANGLHQNKKICCYARMPGYRLPLSAPSTYRFFPRSINRSNHFSQSPSTYIVKN